MSSRQFSFYEFRLYTTFAASLGIGILSCVNLHTIVQTMKDFIKSGQSPEKYQASTQINIKTLEREFITFFSLAAFSLAIFVLIGSQIFRVEEGVIYQNIYNEFTFITVIAVLIGVLCYSISVYKNIANGIVNAPVTLVNVCLLIFLFGVLFFACYRFFSTTQISRFTQRSSYNSPHDDKSSGSGFLDLFRPQSERQKALRQERQLSQQQQTQTLKSKNRATKERLKRLKSGDSSTISSITTASRNLPLHSPQDSTISSL
jgi:sensor histidine kinase YesM